jgi:peroxiredoxin
MKSLPVLTLLLLAACSSLTAKVRGRVVDELGQPMAGAKISLGGFPSVDDLDDEVLLETDANGEFSGLVTFRSGSGTPVRAMAPDGRIGGVGHINRRREPVTIVMRRLSPVQGLVRFDRLSPGVRGRLEKDEEVPFGKSRVLVGRPRVVERLKGPETVYDYVATGSLDRGRFEFLLEPGTYRVQISGLFEVIHKEFTVSAAGEPVDLGELEAKPHSSFVLFGEPAPELKLADARGIPRDFQWSSMRGKTVLLYFWDHRMRKNWTYAIEECYRAYPDRDRFEIIAIHNSDDVVTVADLDRELEFDGKTPVPFPVAVDDAGKTFDAFGLVRGHARSRPRIVIVGPDGTVELWPSGLSPLNFLQLKLPK